MRSMTGFGRARATLADGTEVAVLVRGVNHRFLDVALKLRDDLAALEPALRRLVAESVSRGRVDVSVRVNRPPGRGTSFDEAAAARYAQQWREAAERRGLPPELSPRDLLGLPGVVRNEEESDAEEALKDEVLSAAREALSGFEEARDREGTAVRAALEASLDRLDSGHARLLGSRADLAERLLSTLRERVAKLAQGVPLDEARLAQEVALLADRADVSEEIDRFAAHLSEARRLVAASGPVGKRLDFIVQELHREANTAGQKVRELGAVKMVLDLRSDVESLKEQIQNVE